VEAFESFVAIALEAEGFVVSEAVKFPVAQVVNKASRKEVQTHGFEVDLVAARADRLVLATVKSFLGSRGVVADHVMDTVSNSAARKLYRLLNDPAIRDGVVQRAAERYGYQPAQVQLRFYVGRFAAPSRGIDEAKIREWCGQQIVGSGPIQVFGIRDVVAAVQKAAATKQYRDNAVLVTMKVLEAAGLLTLKLPDDIGAGNAPEALAEE
jgi:hypothetical protein